MQNKEFHDTFPIVFSLAISLTRQGFYLVMDLIVAILPWTWTSVITS